MDKRKFEVLTLLERSFLAGAHDTRSRLLRGTELCRSLEL